MYSAGCPGSCGELFQGKIDGAIVQITCPIDRYSRAAVISAPEGIIIPVNKYKTKKAVSFFINKLSRKIGVKISIKSELTPGIGMSSSSADIFAALGAVAKFTAKSLTPREAAAIALATEPTDGLFLPGVAVFDSREGSRAETIGVIDGLGVVVLDFGGRVETVKYAKRGIIYSKEELARLREAYTLVTEGVVNQDYSAIGAGATLSARVNQRFLYKPWLEPVIRAAAQLGAYGVNVAHSGTVTGVLVDKTNVNFFQNKLKSLFPRAIVSGATIISGGIC